MRIARIGMLVGCLALVATPACDKKSGDAKPAAVKEGDKKGAPPAPTAKAENKAPAAAAKKDAPAAKKAAAKPAGGTGAAVKADDKTTASSSEMPAATECGGMAKAAKPATVAASSSEPAAAGGCGGCGGGGEAAGCGGEAGGCGGCGGGATGVAKADAAKVAHFGAAFTVTDTQPLATVLAKAEKTSDTLVRVKGKIDAVCQKKGCWLVVTDGAMKARIKMKDYGFTVPINSKGKEAVVEGTVTVKVWGEKMVKHLEEDAGRDPAKVKGTRKEFLLTATAIDIRG